MYFIISENSKAFGSSTFNEEEISVVTAVCGLQIEKTFALLRSILLFSSETSCFRFVLLVEFDLEEQINTEVSHINSFMIVDKKAKDF